jgi:hypothetical protein
MSRKAWSIFLGVQTIGEICAWAAGHFLSQVGPVLWIGGTILLLPGNMVGAWVVEKLLWTSGVTIPRMMILEVPVEVAINAAVWLGCAALYIRLRRRQPPSPTSA